MIHMKIDDAFIEYLEWLVRINLSKEEKDRLKREIEILMKYIDEVFQLDITNYSPLIYPKTSIELREDIPSEDGERSAHIDKFVIENGFVRGPRVIKKR